MCTSWKAWSPFVGARFSWALVMSPWFSGPGWPSLCSSMQKYLGYRPSAVHGSPYLLVRPVSPPSIALPPVSASHATGLSTHFSHFLVLWAIPYPHLLVTQLFRPRRCLRPAARRTCVGLQLTLAKGPAAGGGIVLNLTAPLWATEKSITKLFIPPSSVNSFPPKPGAIFLIHEHYGISRCFLWCVLQYRMPFLFHKDVFLDWT